MFSGSPQSDITKTHPMSKIGRVTITTKLGHLKYGMTDFQSEQLDYDVKNLAQRNQETNACMHDIFFSQYHSDAVRSIKKTIDKNFFIV